VSQICGM